MIANLKRYCPRHAVLVRAARDGLCRACLAEEKAKAAERWSKLLGAADRREALRVIV